MIGGLDTALIVAELAAVPLAALLGIASYLLPVGQISFWAATKTFGN